MANKYKLNTYIPYETAEFIKEYSKRFGITMGGAIAVIINEFKKQDNTVKSVTEMTMLMKQLKDSEKGE